MKKKLTSKAVVLMLIICISFIVAACEPSESETELDIINLEQSYTIEKETVFKLSVQTNGLYKMSFADTEYLINCITLYSDKELMNTIGYAWICSSLSFDFVLFAGETYYVKFDYNGSLDYSFIVESSETPYIDNTKIDVTYPIINTQRKIFTFVPTKSGYYTFNITVVNDGIECGFQIFDYINFSSEVGCKYDNKDFSYDVDLEAGKTYFIVTYSEYGDDFYLKITKK